jgi:hypothetical protein
MQNYYSNPNDDEKKREEEFVVADMSNVKRPSLFGHIPRMRPSFDNTSADMSYEKASNDTPVELTGAEKRWYILGVLKASLLIGLAYAVGLGLVIILLLFITR